MSNTLTRLKDKLRAKVAEQAEDEKSQLQRYRDLCRKGATTGGIKQRYQIRHSGRA